jgi:hypothetical protein
MADIFISWANPDRGTVDRLVERLLDVGLPVCEYSRHMPPGTELRQWVGRRIEEASVVVAVLSVAAVEHSDWVGYEVALAANAYELGRLERLVVLRVGDFPADRLPGMLQQDRISFVDVAAAPTEEQLASLVDNLGQVLGDPPHVIPAALYAMTADEFDTLFDPAGVARDAQTAASLAALCHSLGMAGEPGLWPDIRGRYGPTSDDFVPYPNGQRLTDMTQQMLRRVNSLRALERRRPLYLRWYSRAELSSRKPVRDAWQRSHTVLIVDSVSALHRSVARNLQELPHPLDARKRAVVWLPPYTLHTGRVEQLIELSLDRHVFLADTFRAWRDGDELPNLAFDIPTATSLRRWFSQLLLALDTGQTPNRARVTAMGGGAPPQQLQLYSAAVRRGP